MLTLSDAGPRHQLEGDSFSREQLSIQLIIITFYKGPRYGLILKLLSVIMNLQSHHNKML